MAWARRNLFSSWSNSILTLLCLYILYISIVPLVNWALLDATFTGTSKEDCAPGGACWAVVDARFSQYVYGLYPIEFRWRINLAFILLLVAMVPFFLRQVENKLTYAIGLLIFYPIVAYILFHGGVFGLRVVETARWGGLFLTLVIAGVGITASLPLGVILALGRRSDLPIIKGISVTFIELVRGVPLVTILFMASVMIPLFLPEGLTFDKLLRALIGVALFASAYMAEVIRGGLQAIPKGQFEAAGSMGLGYWQMMWHIVLPQALRMVIPGIVNTFIGLFKDTSLVIIIGLYDLLGIARLITRDPQWLGLAAESYIAAAFGFWIFCFAMSRYSIGLERRLNADKSH
ncbi:MAG: amino acid ABC transporter permease [Pseudomonadota bacterium]